MSILKLISFNLYGKPLTFEMKKNKKSKIKPNFIKEINSLSKTYNKLEQYQNKNDINKNLSNHYNTSSFFNNINLKQGLIPI